MGASSEQTSVGGSKSSALLARGKSRPRRLLLGRESRAASREPLEGRPEVAEGLLFGAGPNVGRLQGVAGRRPPPGSSLAADTIRREPGAGRREELLSDLAASSRPVSSGSGRREEAGGGVSELASRTGRQWLREERRDGRRARQRVD